MEEVTERPATLLEALARFQEQLPEIEKTMTAEVETKTGRKYKYDYADLGVISGLVLPLLGALGVSYTAKISKGMLIARLRHVGGDEDTSEWELPRTDSAQEMGSAITYARRYLLCAMTGVAPIGEDDDGKEAARDARRRDAESGTTTPTQRPNGGPLAPLGAVIAKGRQAQMSDDQIRKDLDRIANGRKHADLTADDLRQLWIDYADAAKAIAEIEEEVRRQDASGAGPDDPAPTVVKNTEELTGAEPVETVDALANVGDRDQFVVAGEPVEEESFEARQLAAEQAGKTSSGTMRTPPADVPDDIAKLRASVAVAQQHGQMGGDSGGNGRDEARRVAGTAARSTRSRTEGPR